MIIKPTSATPPKPASMRTNAIFNLVGCLAYQGCLWATTVAIVLISGYDASGVLSYSMAIGNIFLSIASFNIRIYQVSDTNNKYSTGCYIAFRAATIALAFILLVPYVLISTQDKSLLAPVLVYLLFKTDEALCDVLYGIDQKHERMDYIGVSQLIRGISIFTAFCVTLHVTQSILVAFGSMFLGGLTITLVYDIPHARRFETIDISINAASAVSLFRECLPMVAAITLFSSIASLARQLYGNLQGTEALGLYAAIATPSVLIQAASRYLYAPFLVPLANKWNRQEHIAFFGMYIKVFLLICAAGLASVLAIEWVGPKILPILYGPSIEPHVWLLRGVMLATAMTALINFIIDTLVICRDIMGSLIAVAVGFILSIPIAPPLEQIFGAEGINITLISSMSVILIISIYRQVKLFHKSKMGELR